MQIDVVEWYKIGAAIVGIIIFIITCYKIYDKLNDKVTEQGKKIIELEGRIEANKKALEEHHDHDVYLLEEEIAAIKEENYIVIDGILACLDGLEQLKCNGDVPETKERINAYLNKSAHRAKRIHEGKTHEKR